MNSGIKGTVGRLEGVSKKFGTRLVLDAIDLEVRAGEVTALLGPNGAGKTTTVGVLTGRLATDSGRADLFGLDPSRPVARARMGDDADDLIAKAAGAGYDLTNLRPLLDQMRATT